MYIRAVLLSFIVLMACQSGKIPCPEVKFARMKESNISKRGRFAPPPSKLLASTKTLNDQSTSKREINLDRIRASKTTGKQMLEQYGSVEAWDCPSPAGKKRYSKVTKENIRKNEKKMKDHLKNRNASDSLAVVPLRME
jgi:hypothetical protein